MPRWVKTLLIAGGFIYLAIGVAFGILPLLFGAWQVFLMMLVGWPMIFLR